MAGGGPTGATLVRYEPTGELDASFSGDGIAYGPAREYRSIAFDEQGRILAAGSGSVATIARHTPEGALDPSFSDDGSTSFDLGFDHLEQGATGIALQPDGQVLVAGYSCGGLHPACTLLLLSYNPDGSQDQTFGENGQTVVPDRSVPSDGLAVLSSGKPLAIANASGYQQKRTVYALLGFRANGTLNRHVSRLGGGPRPQPFHGAVEAGGLALYPGSRALVVGGSNSSFTLARYRFRNGPPDADAGGVSDPKDACPEVWGAKKSGCPRRGG